MRLPASYSESDSGVVYSPRTGRAATYICMDASMHLFLQAHSHKWNTKEELGKDKHETPTRQRLLVVVGTEIFTIATPARGVVIFIGVNLATRPPTITTDVSVDLAKHGALAGRPRTS